MFAGQVGETPACPAIGRVDLDLLAGLGIFQGNDANVWQDLFAFIANMDRDEIVPASAYRQRPRKFCRLKILDEKYHCTARYDVI